MGLFDMFKKPDYILVSSAIVGLVSKVVVSQEFYEALSKQPYLERDTLTAGEDKFDCLKVTSNKTFGTDDFSVILFEDDLIFLESDWEEITKKCQLTYLKRTAKL